MGHHIHNAASTNSRSTRRETRQGWTPSAKDEELPTTIFIRVQRRRSRSSETNDRVNCDDSTAAVCKSHRRCFMPGMAPSLVSTSRCVPSEEAKSRPTRGVERTRSRSLETNIRVKSLEATSAVCRFLSSRDRGGSIKSDKTPCLSSPSRRPSEEANSPPTRVERTRSKSLEPNMRFKSSDATSSVYKCHSPRGRGRSTKSHTASCLSTPRRRDSGKDTQPMRVERARSRSLGPHIRRHSGKDTLPTTVERTRSRSLETHIRHEPLPPRSRGVATTRSSSLEPSFRLPRERMRKIVDRQLKKDHDRSQRSLDQGSSRSTVSRRNHNNDESQTSLEKGSSHGDRPRRRSSRKLKIEQPRRRSSRKLKIEPSLLPIISVTSHSTASTNSPPAWQSTIDQDKANTARTMWRLLNLCKEILSTMQMQSDMLTE
jgi:hypothetical protein